MMEAIGRPLLAFDTSTPTARVALISPAGECVVERAKTAARHSANLLGLVDEVLREGRVTVGGLGAIACGAGPGSFTGLRVGLAVAKGLALPTGLPLVLVSSLDALACDLAAAAADARGEPTRSRGAPSREGLARPSEARGLVEGGQEPSAELTLPGFPSQSASLLLPCLDAGKGQVYARLYEASGGPRALGDNDWVLSPEDLCRLANEAAAGRPLVAGGTGVDRYLEVMRGALGETAVRLSLPGPSATAIARLARERLARGEHDDIETAVPRYGRPPDITRPKERVLQGWKP
jgi:tRNA threonylcarbamoyladenosine biosynthesis protein TsaB